jgi:hypothetical protein
VWFISRQIFLQIGEENKAHLFVLRRAGDFVSFKTDFIDFRRWWSRSPWTPYLLSADMPWTRHDSKPRRRRLGCALTDVNLCTNREADQTTLNVCITTTGDSKSVSIQDLLLTRFTLYGKRMRKHIDLLISIVHPNLVGYMPNMNIHM